MPNFHPHLVAAVTPFLEPGEEVWAVYAARHRSLVATATRLFLVSPSATVSHPLTAFAQIRRPRPTLVLLQWRAGGSMRIALDPSDEHGIQALTVIGLLLANLSRPEARVPDRPEPAHAVPAGRHLLPTRRYIIHSPGPEGVTTNRSWSSGWTESGAPESGAPTLARRRRLARHRHRLRMAPPLNPASARPPC